MTTQHKEIVVEDVFARLGQLEAKMERQTTQMEKQTELMQNILRFFGCCVRVRYTIYFGKGN